MLALTKKDKKMLLLVLVLCMGTLGYFLVYTPFNNRMIKLNSEVRGLEAQYKSLEVKLNQASQIDNQLKSSYAEIENFQVMLWPEISQEKVILLLRELKNLSGVQFQNIAFTNVTSLTINGDVKKDQNSKLMQASDFSAILDDNGHKKNEQNAYNSIPDYIGIKMEVNIVYTATYYELKDLLSRVMQNPNKTVISKITINGSNNEKLTGNMTMVFYGFKDSTAEPLKWNIETYKGKKNLFTALKHYHLEPNEKIFGNAVFKNNPYDFYMLLDTFESSNGSVVLGKYLKTDAEIRTDTNHFIDVEIHINFKDGKYYFKCKADGILYPNSENDMEEFIPFYNNGIVFKIISRKRKDENDMAGANIHIYNHTDKPVIVKANAEDWAARTRLFAEKGIIYTERDEAEGW